MADEIFRAELEAALREFEEGTAEDLNKTKNIGLGAVAAMGVAAVGAAYAFGRKRSGKEQTFVEVQKVV